MTPVTYTLVALTLIVCLTPGCMAVDSVEDRLTALEDAAVRRDGVIQSLARQMVLDEFEAHQRIRTEGDSGIVQVKNFESGTYSYHGMSYIGETAGSMHDHASTNDTLGYGVFTAVLNGVQFTTRHNDPRLYRASSTSNTWHETEPVELPPVPDTVSVLDNVPDQIAEMQEYFRAFKTQNSSHRAYEDYFKPVLCYLEGTWLADPVTIKEPQNSFRRTFKAYQWSDLAEEARLEAYMGGDLNVNQQTADLPRAIIGYDEDTNEPIFAQWHYRILCHPLSQQVKTEWFKLRELYEYEQRYSDVKNTESELPKELSRGALFVLDDGASPGRRNDTLMDRLVAEIPGKDNIPGEFTDSAFLQQTLDLKDVKTPVNLGFYNRVFQYKTKDAMGHTGQVRGYADANLYTALTTHPEVAALSISYRQRAADVKKPLEPLVKASWMIPLEIVYLTPLMTWNPYNIPFVEGNPFTAPAKVTKPFRHLNAYFFYQTPHDFYTKWKVPNKVHADAFGSIVDVLDEDDTKRRLSASGMFTVSMEIGNDVGHVRLRYPVFPVHYDGNPIWKELEAYKKKTHKEWSDVNKLIAHLTID